jgi:hypothetical protein
MNGVNFYEPNGIKKKHVSGLLKNNAKHSELSSVIPSYQITNLDRRRTIMGYTQIVPAFSSHS